MNQEERQQWEGQFDEEWEKSFYTERGNAPESWIRSADKLLAVVRLLGPSVEVAHRALIQLGQSEGAQAVLAVPPDDRIKAIPVLIMIRAMAVECLLKALYLERRGNLVDRDRYCGPRNHNLVSLARAVGIELKEHESVLLNKLSLWLVSHGRYPVGTTWDFDRKTRDKTGAIAPISSWTPEDNRLCDAFLTLLELLRPR